MSSTRRGDAFGIELVDLDVVTSLEADLIEVELAAILVDCVEDGASVGFLDPLDPEVARAWWQHALRADGTLTWVARDDEGAAVGVVQLRLVGYPNGSHRAEVAKLLVHRRARGRGAARALLAAEPGRRGRRLLVLDTQTGSVAEGLYDRGYRDLYTSRRCPTRRTRMIRSSASIS